MDTLANNVELIQSVLSVLSVPAFILVITALIKNKMATYTPYIAVGIGVIVGIIAAITFVGFNLITVIAGIIYGSITGASAVGIKVVADGEPAQETHDWE